MPWTGPERRLRRSLWEIARPDGPLGADAHRTAKAHHTARARSKQSGGTPLDPVRRRSQERLVVAADGACRGWAAPSLVTALPRGARRQLRGCVALEFGPRTAGAARSGAQCVG